MLDFLYIISVDNEQAKEFLFPQNLKMITILSLLPNEDYKERTVF